MEASEIAAWWGATIATLVLLWDILKWQRAGPVATVSASPNMTIVGGVPHDEGSKLLIAVTATNVGNQKRKE